MIEYHGREGRVGIIKNKKCHLEGEARKISYKRESKACERYFAFAQYDAIKKKRTHYPMNSLFNLNKNLATSYLPRKWPSKYFHRNESLRPCSGWERVFSSRLVTKNVVVTISIA